jgi:hypothetical protein
MEVSSVAVTLSGQARVEGYRHEAPGPERIGAGTLGSRVARSLSAILAALLAGGSAVGLFVDGIYREPASVAAMYRGYDLIALAIIAPALGVMLLPTLRRSPRAVLLWMGLLAYSLFHSAIYVFGTRFNDLFLVHVAVFSLSVFALGMGLANLDTKRIARAFSERTPVRAVGGILLFLAAVLAVFWSGPALRFVFTDELPREGSELVVPTAITHLGWVLDLSLLVPVYAIAGILLWRRAAWGYVLTTIVLIAGVLQQVEYMTALVFQANAHVPGSTGFDPVEPFITSIYLFGALVMLIRMDAASERGSLDKPRRMLTSR